MSGDMVKLGLVSEFDAAHSLPDYMGKCSRTHGHTYEVEMVVEGKVGADGFVIDFYKLKKILSTALDALDHSLLNEILPNPTAENIALLISKKLEGELDPISIKLVSLKLWEGKNKWVMVER